METTAVTFDTHKAVKTLKNAGLEYSQAEAVVETINQAVNETVATKADLQLLSAALDVTNETVGGLKETVGDLKKNMATKEGLANNDRALGDLKETVTEMKATMATKEYVKMEIAKAVKHMYIISLTQTIVLVTLVVTLSKLL